MRDDTADTTPERTTEPHRPVGHHVAEARTAPGPTAPAAITRHTARHLAERGASLVEYALLVALIAIACIGAVTFLGGENAGSVDKSADCIAAAQDGQPLPASCP